MLTTDPVIQAGVLATRECMIPGRARIKHSVQCFLRELMREWPTDESEDLLFSITVASKRVGLDRSVLYVGRRNLVADDAIRFRQREDGSIVYYVDWAKIVNAYGMKRLGVQVHGESHSFESAGCPKEPCTPEPDPKQHKRSSKKGE